MPKSKAKSLRIESISLIREVDVSPDTSWIGEYASQPGPDDRTIDREERGDCERGQYRYFIAANGPDETGNPKSVEEDYRRMELLNRGDWCFFGISAEAKVIVNGVFQTIRSGGLWGIESDSGDAYFRTVAAEELSNLRDTLAQLGFTEAQLIDAFHGAEDADWTDR